MKTLLCVFFCVFLLVQTADEAGFKATVTQSGLNYATSVAVEILRQKLSTLKIPDFSGSADAPVIGKIDYQVTGIQITSIAIGSAAIKAQNNLQVDVSGVQIQLNGAWHYREHSWPHVSGHGTVDVSISGSTFTLPLVLGRSATGEPTCSTTSVGVNLANFDIKDHGGADWLYNILVQAFKGDIKNAFTKQISDAVASLVNNDLNKELQGIPLKQQIETYGIIDYSLVAAPAIGNGYLSVPGKGLFESATNPAPPPFGPTVPLPDMTSSAYMIQFFLSDFVANSLFYSLYKSGILDFTITPQNEPAGFPQFNTNAFEFLIPALFFKYPGWNMSAVFTPEQSPEFIIDQSQGSESLFNATATYSASFSVIAQNKTVIPVFTLGAVVNGYFDAMISANNFHAKILEVDLTLSVSSSNIGPFTVTGLQVVINSALNAVVVPEINNSTLANGFPIPVIDGVSLVNPSISSAKGFLCISSNLHYGKK